MKALKWIVTGMVLFLAGATQAQVNMNANSGSPPPWGPAGYTGVRYYYLPDVEAYYDIQASMFICNVEGAWIHKSRLPSVYIDYDLYGGYKVVLTDYHGNAPYFKFNEHKTQYAKGYRGPEQQTIGEKPGIEIPDAKMSKKGSRGDGKSAGPDSDSGVKK